MSPVKNANKTNYFECMLQTKEEMIRGVCFSPEKKPLFDVYKVNRNAVNISKFRSDGTPDSKDIIIDKKSQITQATVSPNFDPIDISNVSFTTISSLEKININQLLTIKAKVVNLSGVKTFTTSEGKTLKKQEGTLVDHTGDIRIQLWENDTDTLIEGKTYKLSNVRLKQNRGERYLTPPKSGECEITETAAFKTKLADVTVIPNTLRETNANIIAIQSVQKITCCCNYNCRKQIEILQHKKIVTCSHCKTTQKTEACTNQWFLKLWCQLPDSSKVSLSVFQPQLVSLAKTHFEKLNLNNATSDEIIEEILSLDEIKLTYDSSTRKILSFNKLDK